MHAPKTKLRARTRTNGFKALLYVLVVLGDNKKCIRNRSIHSFVLNFVSFASLL